MTDVRKELTSKYEQSRRFSNFGHVITEITIGGFRGVSADITFDYPVTALTGFNGSGKSTVGQLMICGYRRLSTALTAKRFYIKDFFPVSVVDPTPFDDGASVSFKYQTDKVGVQQELTISRAKKEWSGYKRQPERNCEYVGFTVYVPKVERRDLSIYNAASLVLTEKSEIESVQKHVSKILGAVYDDVYFQGVSAKSKKGELGIASRYGASYSENNMGFGEGRVVYSVRLLETCPEQSLIVLEEPETSLHENAQFEFVKYLMDVSARRRHQIVLSTHSSIMMDALPTEGRKLLVRSKDGVEIHSGISSARIRTALSAGERGHAILCVEDYFAKALLQEILRRFDINMLESVEIIPFGDKDAVISAMKALQKAGLKAIAVRDADMTERRGEQIFKLPGRAAPEKEVFLSAGAQAELNKKYHFDLLAHIRTHDDLDHHQYSETAARKIGFSKEVLESDCIRAFLDEQGPDWSAELCNLLKTHI